MTSFVGNPIPLVTAKAGFPVVLPANIVRVVAKAIKYAWKEIEDAPSKHLVPKGTAAPEEDTYNDALCNMLEQMLNAETPVVDGFNSELFDTVCRSESLPNYCGTSLNKSPDLIIRLAHSPLSEVRRLVGVFIESKIVTSSKPMSNYTSEGLSRFVNGDYGWTMQAGMMLAYQKDKPRALRCLEAQLNSDSSLQSQQSSGTHLEIRPEFAPITCVSSHNRNWVYVNGDTPGLIRVWHIWDLNTPQID